MPSQWWFRACLPRSHQGFPCGSAGKESGCKAADPGSIPGLGRSPGEGKGYPLQYSDLENSTDCIDHGVTKSQTWPSDFHYHDLCSLAALYWLWVRLYARFNATYSESITLSLAEVWGSPSTLTDVLSIWWEQAARRHSRKVSGGGRWALWHHSDPSVPLLKGLTCGWRGHVHYQ